MSEWFEFSLKAVCCVGGERVSGRVGNVEVLEDVKYIETMRMLVKKIKVRITPRMKTKVVERVEESHPKT